ncbi:MAG: type II secretion system F family protein [Candidatus Omnitrophica bacterium]|nr:type II secretion system F family protein [Candidatus Omnitrophota bacterium]MDD5654783.1 type II secretion system F family protein [Candidatus Omnitrophota bacterium]
MDLIILIFVFIFIMGSVYYISKSLTKDEVHLSLEQPTKQAAEPAFKLRQILTALSGVVKPLEKSLPTTELKKKLTYAGSPLTVLEFFAFKLLSLVIVPVIVFIVFKKTEPMYLGFSLFAGYIFPDIWLKQKVQKRQSEIARDLPAVIDLLTLCVGAGLNFMLAIDRVVKDFKKCPLTEELAVAWQEIQMGRTRQDALRGLAARLGMPEISSFVRTLIQADRMGSPMGDALKIQSDEVRMRRFLRGEEMALKAPIKLLFPLLFFILPVVLIVVGGPVILQFLKGGGLSF